MAPATRSATAQGVATENVHVRVHDAETLRDQWPGWDENPKWVKRRLAKRVEPEEEHHHTNTTCVALDEYRVDNLHSGTAASETATHLAVGTSTTTPAYSDRSLGTEVDRVAVTDDSNNGIELFTSTFLDTSEANGNNLEEVGLVTDDGSGSNLLLNHSLIQTINKTDETTATIDVTLTFSSA